MVDMNLVSLIDVFTILIFFLLAHSVDVQTLSPPAGVRLPQALCRAGAARRHRAGRQRPDGAAARPRVATLDRRRPGAAGPGAGRRRSAAARAVQQPLVLLAGGRPRAALPLAALADAPAPPRPG
jgi:hypothetical protein